MLRAWEVSISLGKSAAQRTAFCSAWRMHRCLRTARQIHPGCSDLFLRLQDPLGSKRERKLQGIRKRSALLGVVVPCGVASRLLYITVPLCWHPGLKSTSSAVVMAKSRRPLLSLAVPVSLVSSWNKRILKVQGHVFITAESAEGCCSESPFAPARSQQMHAKKMPG